MSGGYTAVTERHDDWWIIQVEGADVRFVTQARRLAQVEHMARDALALLLDVPEGSFDVKVEVRLPESVLHALERAAELRQEAHLAAQAAGHAQAEAARALLTHGLTMREAGQMLGLSHQRVSQLVQRSRSAA